MSRSSFHKIYHNRYLHWLAIAFLTVAITLSVWQWILFPTEILAGSIQLINARLIRQGLTIHQDFWSKETPLVFYLNSWAFRILGESVIAAKLVSIIIYLCMVLGFYCYYSSLAHRSRTTIIICTLGSAYLTLFSLIHTKWIAYAFSALAFIVYLTGDRYSAHKSRILLIVSGLLTGCALLSKLNCGAYVFAAVILGLLCSLLLGKANKPAIANLFWYSLPVSLCLSLYFANHYGHLTEVFEQIVLFPGRDLGEYRIISLAHREESFISLLDDFAIVYLNLVFPLIWFHLQLVKLNKKLSSTVFVPLYLALVILPACLIAEFQSPLLLPKLFVLPLIGITICQFSTRALPSSQFATLCGYSLFLHYYLSRSDSSHYVPLLFFVIVLLFNELLTSKNLSFPQRYFYGVLATLAYFICSMPAEVISSNFFDFKQISNSRTAFQLKDTLLARGDSNYLMSAQLPLSSPEAEIYQDRDELAALQFVHRQTVPDDYVYVGVTDHSQVFVSNLKPYWQLGRKIGVKNYALEPGFTTEVTVQQEMISQLKSNDVQWLILWQQPEADPDFKQRSYVGSKLLDRYIRQDYILIKQLGNYEVYRKTAS